MKNFILLTCIVALALSATAQQGEKLAEERKADDQSTMEAPVSGPKMTLESTVIDYGDIEQGSEPVRMVKFTNTGTEPLIISNAKGSCGCTVPTWPREPIAPGETSEIKVRYDTKRLGNINKTVKLTTNDATGTYVIRVTGKISPKTEEEGLPEKKGIFESPNN